MQGLLSQRRAHGNREPASGARTSSNPPARRPRRAWRPLLAAAGTTALLALTAAPAYAQGT
jgi:hypothetical protein